MSCYYIKLEKGRKKAFPVTSAEEYKSLRSGKAHLTNLALARKGNEKAKQRLIQFNYSCLPNEDGSLKGATQLSTSVGMDIDHIPAEQLPGVIAKVLEKKEALGLLMLERSARGEGLHVVFKRHPELNNVENLQWASELLGVEFDKGAKDITRVFFATGNTEDDLLYLCEELFENGGVNTTVILSESEESQSNITQSNITQSSLDGDSSLAFRMTKGETKGEEKEEDASPLNYSGIPYSAIIQKWWEMYNDGQEPVKSNRDVLTFELAVNLRHICGFDREILDKVIPCYDGFPEVQKLKCIDSALAERRTQMPKRIKDVLNAFRQDQLKDANGTDSELLNALDEMQKADELYHYDKLPKMPQGVKESIDAAGHNLALPTLIAIAPAIGALATDVKLDVHGRVKGLNLMSFIVGEFASGKGQLDDVIAAWMKELQTETDMYTQQEEEWASKTKRMKSGKAPEQPQLPVRMLTLNNTVANIAERLSNTEGKHCFSFTPEADNVALKWKQSVSDFSVMLRQAYDEARYDREAKSADAVRVHIDKLLWNVTMCGTQDALYRVITNYTDGLLSRISIARTPDNTFSPLDTHPAQLTPKQSESIQEIAHLLPFMKGNITLPKLEERGREWLEMIRLEAIKNDDRVLARQRMRGCVNAQRITCALMLPRVAEQLIKKFGVNGTEVRLKKDPSMWIETMEKLQNQEMLQLFDTVADYLLDNDLYFFRERIEQAYESKNYAASSNSIRARRGRNDNIFERLSTDYSFEQAYQQSVAVKGGMTTHNSVRQMLKNWCKQGLIYQSNDGMYHKSATTVGH